VKKNNKLLQMLTKTQVIKHQQ